MDNNIGPLILEHARYGEVEELKAALAKKPSQGTIDFKSSNGCSGLHYASANGNVACVKLLIESKASHFPNKSGNTPLQWAAQLKQNAVVKLLLESYKHINVLRKNEFGKGAMTEAFTSGDVDILQDMLLHHSATEEKLLEGNEEKLESLREATHSFIFNSKNKIVKIREKAIVEPNLASIAGGVGLLALADQTGLGLWGASVILSRWMLSLDSDKLRGKSVLELGAGCGLAGLSVAVFTEAKSVVITDLAKETVQNMSYNVELNKGAFKNTKVTAETIDWNAYHEVKKTEEDATVESRHKLLKNFDIVIGSDLVYDRNMVPVFLRVLQDTVRNGGEFFYVTALERAGRGELASALLKGGFKMVKVSKPPKEYRAIPLKDTTQEECDLLLVDLKDTEYQLWHLQHVKKPELNKK
eukprot:jgi/Bigna1/89717/estExt_fgenesh1_pg.C_540071